MSTGTDSPLSGRLVVVILLVLLGPAPEDVQYAGPPVVPHVGVDLTGHVFSPPWRDPD